MQNANKVVIKNSYMTELKRFKTIKLTVKPKVFLIYPQTRIHTLNIDARPESLE